MRTGARLRSALLVGGTLWSLGGCATQKAVEASVEEPRRPVREAPPPDPANEIQISGETGTVDASDVDAAMRPRARVMADCYQQGLRHFRYLGGDIEVKVRVAHDGHVLWVAPVKPLGNVTADQCIQRVIRGTPFPSPTGGAEAEFSYDFALHAEKARIQDWGPERVEALFRKHAPELRACVGETPPAGLHAVLFIGPGGKVSSVGVGADAAIDDRVASCVAAKIEAWRFPDPRGTLARATFDLATGL